MALSHSQQQNLKINLLFKNLVLWTINKLFVPKKYRTYHSLSYREIINISFKQYVERGQQEQKGSVRTITSAQAQKKTPNQLNKFSSYQESGRALQ